VLYQVSLNLDLNLDVDLDVAMICVCIAEWGFGVRNVQDSISAPSLEWTLRSRDWLTLLVTALLHDEILISRSERVMLHASTSHLGGSPGSAPQGRRESGARSVMCKKHFNSILKIQR